jgi:hypothetical protein
MTQIVSQEPITGFEAPVHRALTEPILLAGAPVVDPRHCARQDRRDEGPDPHPPPMVRQAQVGSGDPQGGDDQ